MKTFGYVAFAVAAVAISAEFKVGMGAGIALGIVVPVIGYTLGAICDYCEQSQQGKENG